MRLIDADVLTHTIHNEWDGVLVCDESGITIANEFERLVDDAPTIEERKKGKWIINEDDDVISGTCSCCGWNAILLETDVTEMSFCPNCGAMMEGRL